MGLDINTGNYSFRAGSYNGFHSFRNWLAQKLGHENLTDYYNTYCQNEGPMLKSGTYKNARKIPLGPLLNHSDCDGTISTGYAKKLLTELTEIKEKLKKYNELDTDTNNETYFRKSLDHWISACKESIENKDPIEFH